ncbi:MAG: hypothetical protein L6Q33_15225, partial [Bacteriovoracaceae bacterium]|nr:hypothetical protein [Bacteriovoracaceae bacterium]
MMKMLVFLSLVFGLCKYAGAEETFTYSQSMECYVKSYENRVFKFVDDDYFVGKPLKVAELKRTPDFVAFKVNGKMYLAPKKCFTANEAINEDVTFEAMAYEEKNEKKKERIRKVFTKREKKKNYLNLSTGMNFSKKNMPVSKDNQFYLQAGDSVESLPIQSVENVNTSKHSNDLAFRLEYGALKSESVHWIVSLKKTGKKISEYQSVVFDVSGIPVASRWNLDWQMSSV